MVGPTRLYSRAHFFWTHVCSRQKETVCISVGLSVYFLKQSIDRSYDIFGTAFFWPRDKPYWNWWLSAQIWVYLKFRYIRPTKVSNFVENICLFWWKSALVGIVFNIFISSDFSPSIVIVFGKTSHRIYKLWRQI